jgi:hypothetical protein
MQGPQDLQRPENAVDAIKFTTSGLGIKVASGLNWRKIRITSFPSCKDISHLIDGYRASDFFAPGLEKVPSLTIQVGECEPAGPAFIGGTDFCHFHQALPKPGSIDFDHFYILRIGVGLK